MWVEISADMRVNFEKLHSYRRSDSGLTLFIDDGSPDGLLFTGDKALSAWKALEAARTLQDMIERTFTLDKGA